MYKYSKEMVFLKKKLALSILSLLLLIGIFTAGVFAANGMTLIVNGVKSDAEIQVINGSSYVPLRAVAELLGAEVNYDATTRTITINSDGSTPSPVQDRGQNTGQANNETKILDGLQITLNDVEYKTTGTFDPDNDHYVVLDLTLTNTTNEAIHVSTLLQMELQDDQGYKHSPALYIDGKGTLDGEIAAGDTIRGQVAFDVDKSSTYRFIFSGFLSGQVSWTFDGK